MTNFLALAMVSFKHTWCLLVWFQVLLLLKNITSILPSFREGLAKNGSILTQLQVLANSSDRGAGVARELLTTLAAT